jgi:formylglycine-generating enzyme required for sulfatase activity
MDFHANTSELVQILEKGHHDVTLTKEEWDRLYTWIDLNVPYHGKFQAGRYCDHDQDERRNELAELFGGATVDIEEELVLAASLKDLEHPAEVNWMQINRADDVVTGSTKWTFDAVTAMEKQSALGVNRKTIRLTEDLVMKMVKVPAGAYVRPGVDGAKPVKVEVKAPYWISAFEVTNEQFGHFFPEHDSRFVAQFWKDHTTPGYPANLPDQPVVRVSWEECVRFCEKLTETTGMKFRLPSADQWEWACRAGSGDAFWFGGVDEDFSSYENLADVSLADFAVIGVNPQPMGPENPRFPYYNFIPQAPFDDGAMISTTVGQYQCNPWGLYDMHGNVSEWVSDAHVSGQAPVSSGREADMKMVRGGSWRDRPYRGAAYSTLGYYRWQKVVNVGFRVIMEE